MGEQSGVHPDMVSPTVERGPERVLTIEEVRSAMRELIGFEGMETDTRSDENGLYLREVTVEGPKANEMSEYTYRRIGEFRGHTTRVTTVEVVYYVDGIPVSGKTVANFVEGKWERQ